MPPPFKASEVLGKLSLAEKIGLLSGADFWHFNGASRVGVPRLRASDGPNGVRGTRFFNGTPSSCFPSATGLASSFNVQLAHEVGIALAEECAAKSVHCHLGPTVNTQRSPLGGRGFESFSEDPHLSGMIGAAYVNGVQSKGVASCPKHFCCNDQEFERFSSDSVVSERALREIYLEPFRLIQKHAAPKSYMTAYNRVNGVHASESEALLRDILRKEWGFSGVIMSDWTGVYSVVESIKAGLDVEMPGPAVMRTNAAVGRMLAGQKLTIADIDARVLKVLELVEFSHASGIPFCGPEKALDSPERRALLRRAAAEAIVLLKNDDKLLPLTKSSGVKNLAVIGTNARTAVPSGGGSAHVFATYTTSPLEGIKEAARALDIEVTYAMGPAAYRYAPLLDSMMKDGVLEFWKEQPVQHFASSAEGKLPKPDHVVAVRTSFAMIADGLDSEVVGLAPHIRFSATFVPDISGDWEFGLVTAGFSRLFIDGNLCVDNMRENYSPGELAFGMASEERRAVCLGLKAGQPIQVEVRSTPENGISKTSPFPFFGVIQVGALPTREDDAALAEAVEQAKAADAAVVVVGTNKDWELEGFDRRDMTIPGKGAELVDAVLKVNPKTVVIVQSGMPCEMPFACHADTIIQAFFGGNEGGNAMSDVLFGAVNPSGKLPLTFPRRLKDNPSYSSFGATAETSQRVLYNEGIYVGYRFYDRIGLTPEFAFGHGLSYTQFEYDDLSIGEISPDGKCSVAFAIKNTGDVAGQEVAQVYISDLASSLPRPVKCLAGFKKLGLGPGSTGRVTIELAKEALSYWNPSLGSWVAEAGDFEIGVGGASDDLKLRGKVTLKETFTWRGL